jgi:hypothetical protein
VPINVAMATEYTDRSGRYGMKNVRAEMYWRLREALDPDHDSTLCLPPDPELLADLTAPTFDIVIGGIKVESKDDIKDRLKRSPDAGDAVCLAMLESPGQGLARMGGPDRHAQSPVGARVAIHPQVVQSQRVSQFPGAREWPPRR